MGHRDPGSMQFCVNAAQHGNHTQDLILGILGSLGMKSAFCLSVKELTGTKEDHQGPRPKQNFLTIGQLLNVT